MFFKRFSEMLASSTDVTLTIHKQNGTMTVSVLPKANGLQDEAQNHLKPIVITGTPEELDEGFLDAVREPVRKAATLLSGMKSFEDSLAKVEANRKEEQEKKKEADKLTQERKAQFDKLMTRVEELEAEEKYDEALAEARKAVTLATGSNVAKVKEKVSRLNGKSLNKSLFQ